MSHMRCFPLKPLFCELVNKMNIYGYASCTCGGLCDMLALYKLERWEGAITWVIIEGITHSDLSNYPGIAYLGSENFAKNVKKFIDFSEDHLTGTEPGVI